MKILKNITPMYPNAILVTLTLDDDLLSIQTTDHSHGKSARFVTCAELFQSFAEGTGTWVCDNDLHNFLKAYQMDREHLYFDVSWLRETSCCLGTLEGWHQSFVLPVSALRRALTGEKVRCLLLDRNGDTRCPIRFSPSGHEVIRGLTKRERRALSKALSRNFQWRFDAVELTQDLGRKDFFFRSAYGITGGFILSSRTITGRDGQEHEALSYNVHT